MACCFLESSAACSSPASLVILEKPDSYPGLGGWSAREITALSSHIARIVNVASQGRFGVARENDWLRIKTGGCLCMAAIERMHAACHAAVSPVCQPKSVRG